MTVWWVAVLLLAVGLAVLVLIGLALVGPMRRFSWAADRWKAGLRGGLVPVRRELARTADRRHPGAT